MLNIGITGQSGFIGGHLYRFLSLRESVNLVPFEDRYFENPQKMQKWVKQCDVIVHLAAMNRHQDPNVIYDTNIYLVKLLIKALESTNSKPHVIFSSSTQEENDNLYGKSKREGRDLLEQWAVRKNAQFTGLVIPNVFGPFGKPYYNSVIATFCHQLNHNEKPEIHFDGELRLIYVGELVDEIFSNIVSVGKHENKENYVEEVSIKPTANYKVSSVLSLLNSYKSEYVENGIFPDLSSSFERNLFNTFVTYIEHKSFFPFFLKCNADSRGRFVETVKLNSGGQVSFSTTKPGITRGNHFHTRKAERFAVIKGKARIQLRKIGTKEVFDFELDGEQPSFVDMPVWYTHNITNVGNEDLYTIFWISELFDSADPDTYFEEV